MNRAARAPDPRAALSVADIARLKVFMHRYHLQVGDYGEPFTRAEASRLVFQKWRAGEGDFADDRAPAAEGEWADGR